MKAIHATLCALLLLAVWPAGAAPRMYVPTGSANEVVVIDVRSDRIVKRIDELENAHGLAGNTRSFYLVAGSLRAAQAGASPPARPAAVDEARHAAHHRAGGVPETAASFVSLIDRQQERVIRRIGVRAPTHHTAVSPDGEYAVAVHSGAGGISVIDLDEQRVIATVDTGPQPNFAVFSRDGRELYVSNAGAGTISIVTTADWRVRGEIDVGGQPEHLVLSPEGKRLFVVNVYEDRVQEVDLPGAAVRNSYAVGRSPHAADVSEDRRWLFVSVKGENRVTRIDLESGARRHVNLEPAPYHLEYVDRAGKLYVSSRERPTIWVLDPRTLEVLREIDLVRGVGHQMVVLGQ